MAVMKSLFSLRILILTVIVVGIIGLALWLKAASGEDAWLCVDGQWIRHGNPSVSMPTTPCTQATLPDTRRADTRVPVPADQPMTVFTANDFSLSYPDWPIMNPGAVLEPERTKVAVSNAGCAVVMTMRPLTAGEDFRTELERLLSDQITQASVRILQKNITATSSHVEGEFRVQNNDIRSDQYGYVTSQRQFYSLVFAAEKSAFENACKPVIEATVKSVKVK